MRTGLQNYFCPLLLIVEAAVTIYKIIYNLQFKVLKRNVCLPLIILT